MIDFKLPRKLAAAVAAAASVVLLAGCGSNAAGTSSGSGPAEGSVPDSVPSLEELFKGSEGLPPTNSPPPAKDKVIYWVSCGEKSAACATYSRAGKAAVEAIGWKFHLVDANLNEANGNAAALRTAIAARPDAIVQSSFSCETSQPALEEAKAAGIPVIGVTTLDCSDTGGPQLFTVPLKYSDAIPTNAALWTAYGTHSADYIIASSGGKAKVLASFGQGDPQFKLMNEGFKSELAKCSGCSVVAELPWTPASLTPNGPWVTSLRNALIQHPDATHAWFPFDILAVEIGGAKAVTEGGGQVKSISGTGVASALDLVRSGQIDAEGYARSSEWLQWAAIDSLNRFFNNSPAVSQGIGLVAIDKEHNMPPNSGQSYQTKVDFQSLYKKAWGVS